MLLISPNYLRTVASLAEALDHKEERVSSFEDWLNHLKFTARRVESLERDLALKELEMGRKL